MASWTEKYAAPADVGSGTGADEANAMDLATALTSAAGGERWNCISGSYSIGTTTVASGTAAAPIVFRGYKTTPGDLDNQGRNADGTLNTTDMPDITITGLWTPGAYTIFQNLDVTGALSSALISSTSVDNVALISTKVVNSQNNSSARAVLLDDNCRAVNCDLECSGASHTIVYESDQACLIYGCRFTSTANTTCCQIQFGVVIASQFIGPSSAVGVVFDQAIYGIYGIVNCGFDSIGKAFEMNNVGAYTSFPVLINLLGTDLTSYIDNPYSSYQFVICMNRRTRDVTTVIPSDVLDLTCGADDAGATGDDSTDYVNSGAGNYRPATSAPGRGTGMPAYTDKGAYQAQESAGTTTIPATFGFL